MESEHCNSESVIFSTPNFHYTANTQQHQVETKNIDKN